MTAVNTAFVCDDIDDVRNNISTNQNEQNDIIISNGNTAKISTDDVHIEDQPSSEDVLMDVLAETIDVFQISSMVSTLTIMISGVCIFFSKTNPPNGKWQWISLAISGLFLGLGMPTAMLSLKYMDIGASIALIYTLPIFTGIFGWIILKESLKLIHVLFVAVSLAGVIFIAQPEFIFGSNGGEEHNRDENLLLGTIFALLSAVSYAVLVVVARKQTGVGMHLFVLMFCNAIVVAILNAIICTGLNAWKTPTLANWFEILGFATIDFGAQIFLIAALTWEVAILVSIAVTSEVMFAFMWQISIFRVYPDWRTGVGAFLIVSTCIGTALCESSDESEGGTDTTEETQKESKPTDSVQETQQDGVVVPTFRRADNETP